MPTISLANSDDRKAASGNTVNPLEFNELLLELTGLMESASTPEEFFAPYLEKVMEITGATGVAVWQRHAGGQLQLLKEFNFGALNLERVPNGLASHSLLLEEAAISRRSHWITPVVPQDTAKLIKANYSPLALILAPIVVDDKIVGLLEVSLPADQERQHKRFLTRLTTELAGLIGTFWHKRQWKQLQDQQQIWQHLEAFAAQIHQSLNPREVAYLAVNDGKRLVECDQLAVAQFRASSCEVLAINGAVAVERRSPLVQAMEAMLAAVADTSETIVYQGGRDESLPPKILAALDTYLTLSNCRLLVALPLIDPRLEGSSKVAGLLLAESFDATLQLQTLRPRLDFVARHIGPALSNALAMDRLPLKWLTRPLANVQHGLESKSRVRLLAFVSALVVLSALLTFVPLPLKPEATGQLVPQERRVVYSSLAGKILQLAVKQGDQVEKGQELLFVQDLDTQLKVDQLSVKISAFGQKLNSLEEQLNKLVTAKERADNLNERIRTQYDLGKAKVERLLLLNENRNPQKAPMVAPLAGQVLTFDAKEKLLGKTVKVGDPLLRLAATDGPWEVELFIPERQAGLVRSALFRDGAGELDVDLLLTSDPHRVYKGKLYRGSLGGETIIQNDKVVLPAHVTITDPVLIAQVARMPVGVEVHARVQCGHASAGYVLFNEIWTFVYESFIF